MTELKRKSSLLFIVLVAGLTAVLWPVISFCEPDGKGQPSKVFGSVELNLQVGQPEYHSVESRNDSVRIKDFSWFQSPGNPRLPSKIYNVLLPPDADISTVRVTIAGTSAKEVKNKFDIKPCPPYAVQQEKPKTGPGGRRRGNNKPGKQDSDQIKWGKGKKIENGRNLLIYKRNGKFPSSPVQLINTGRYGSLKYARIRFMPVQYNPVMKKLTLSSSVKCIILFNTGNNGVVSDKAMGRLRGKFAQKFFINADEAESWYEPESAKSDAGGPLPNAGDNSGYLIVTTNEIEGTGALDSFVSYKLGLGWTVTVITEDEYGSSTGQTRADNIRSYLQGNYVSMNLKYVLLVGDPRVDDGGLPMKKTYPFASSYGHVPSDYYYADLTGDWDLDSDGNYGEFAAYPNGDRGTGGVDFVPEVYVGRIPVYTTVSGWQTTLQSIMTKIIDYGSDEDSDRKWRRSILLPESFSDFDTDGAYLAEDVIDSYVDANHFSYYRMYQQGGYDEDVDSLFDMPDDCEQEFRSGDASASSPESVAHHWANHTEGYGMVFWWGHGNQYGAYAGYGEEQQDPEAGGAFMYSTWVGNLDNSKPAFTVQISCTNADPAYTNNLAYSLLTQGAIATFAGTNVTYYMPSQKSFNDTGLNAGIGYEYAERLVAGDPCGDSYYNAIAALDSDDEVYWWNFMTICIYGDPSCGLDIPTYLSITTDSLMDCEESVSYSAFIEVQDNTGTCTWSWSGDLPSGLSLDTATGEIYGTPTQDGIYRFTVSVTDSSAPSDTLNKKFKLNVYAVDGGMPSVASFSGTAQSTSSIEWSWTEPSGDFEGYVINGGDYSAWHEVAAGTTSLLETGFGPNTQVTRHIHTFGSISTLFSDDFSGSTGWTWSPDDNKNEWEIGQANDNSPLYGYGDPDNDHSPTSDDNVLGYDIGGNYADRMSIKKYAISPVVDCSGVDRMTLRFWRWLNVEKSRYDQACIYVSDDGGSTWTKYWNNPYNYDVNDSSWNQQEITISATAAGQSNVKVSFVLGPTDNALNMSGWNVDDLELIGISDTLSNSSSDDSVYTLAAVPGAITSIRIPSTSLKVDWATGGNPSGTEYELECSETGGGAGFTNIYTGTELTFTDTGLGLDTTYYYRVRAQNGDEITTDWSDEYAATTSAWNEPQEIATEPGAINPQKGRLMVDSQGTLHCLWQQTDNALTDLRNIYYSYQVTVDSWSTPTLLSTSNPGGDSGAVDHPHMVLDSNDNIHVVWGGFGANNAWQVWYRKCESGTWLDPIEVTTDTDYSYWPDIAVDSSGQIHVVFVRFETAYWTEEVYHTSSSNGITWSAVTNVSESTDSFSWGPSIEIDNSDLLHVTWSEEISGSYDVLYRNFDGTSWSAVVNISNSSGWAYQSDIVISNSGTILVAWQDNTGGAFHPMYSIYNGAQWSEPADIAAIVPYAGGRVNVGYYDDTFYASWQSSYDGTRQVLFSSFNGGSWSNPITLSSSSDNSFLGPTGGAIAVGDNGVIYLIFNGTLNNKLWCTTRN